MHINDIIKAHTSHLTHTLGLLITRKSHSTSFKLMAVTHDTFDTPLAYFAGLLITLHPIVKLTPQHIHDT